MMQGNSMDGGRSRAGDAREFWNGVLDRRIAHIGNAPPAQRYSNATVSNVKALDEERRVLQDEIENFRRRCDDENQALHSVLDALREHRAREERAIEVTIANIHRRRNDLIPISRLPPEILSQIFVLHAKLEPLKWTEAALTSTGVCKQWRQIGLDCPELWSSFDDRSVAWMATMMERSRSVPLTLSVIKQEDMSSRKMALIADNMYRFEYLDLDIPTANTHRFLELFSGPVPLLKNLDIVYRGDATFVFPSDFLGGSAPNLRHIMLTITHSYVPWTSGLFANLVTLNIDRDADGEPDGPEAPSLEMLLSALTRMPGLESLALWGCLPSPTSSAITAHVDLPKLNHLWTSGLLGNTTYLFRQITINPSAVMGIKITCFRVSKEDIDEFFAIFRLCTAPSPTARALTFNWEGPFGCQAGVWTVEQAAEVKNKVARINLIFNWGSEIFRGVRPLVLTWAWFATFASPRLHSFRITGDHIVGWDVEVWRKLARTSPNLRRLALGNDTMQCVELLKALRPPDGQDLVPTDCCLPALSYLELSTPPNHPVLTSDGESTPLSEVLSALLSVRATAGCLVPELVFILSSEEDFVGDWSKPFRDAVPGIIVRTIERGEEVM